MLIGSAMKAGLGLAAVGGGRKSRSPWQVSRKKGNSKSMARKVLNRKELRDEAAAAEAAGKKTKKKAVKTAADGTKKPVKRKSRAKAPKEVRLKAFWAVFNQSMKRVALFDYSQRKQAQKKADELTLSSKQQHFIAPHKDVIEE
jgi:hypothetical protein